MVAETVKSKPAKKQAKYAPPCERILRLRSRYQTQVPRISISRALHYTNYWKETEGQNIPAPVRVASAMKRVFENSDSHVDPDDRIAGYWTEDFLGIPVSIEKGEYNKVLQAELSKSTLARFRARSLGKGLRFMLRKRTLGEFLKNQKIAKEGGTQPLNMSLKTMPERAINPFTIDPADRRVLLGELLPWWDDRCLADKLEAELAQSGLYSGDMHDFVVGIPGNTSRQVMMLSTCATIATIQGHVILDYEKVLKKGLSDLLDEVRATMRDGKGHTKSEWEFLRSQEIALEGVMIFARRLADKIKRLISECMDDKRKSELREMHEVCARVPMKPAASFREAVQAIWTVKTAVEMAHPVNLHCFGRLDQNLWPYYKKDLKAGRITPDQARELLEELLLKIMSQNIRPESNILANFYHRYLGSSPVTLGGVKADGSDAANDLTHLFLHAAHNSKAITNISVRIHPQTPDDLFHTLADFLHEGTSSYSLFNDVTNIEAMRRKGFSQKDARDYAVMGCVESTCPGKTGSMSANAILLNRILDITLRNGDSRTIAGLIRDDGLKTGDPDDFKTFDELLGAFFDQAKHFVEKIKTGSNLRDRLYEKMLPAPYISAFMDGCLENKKDTTQGGARYDLSGISMINSIANLTDSLYVIKKLIFEKRAFTFAELMKAVDDNFAGHEEIYRRITEVRGKWGNGNAETDELAASVAKKLFSLCDDGLNHRGGPFVVYVISMMTHTFDGRLSIAGPDGRKAATPYAASCNPYNVERSGVTAALRSVASLPFEDTMGCAVNMKFHPSGIGESAEARAKWISLIRGYFAMGGAQIQPTVASAEMLREAQKNPDEYRDLIVKVGGYSTYFTDLGCELQQEIIDRTEHRL